MELWPKHEGAIIPGGSHRLQVLTPSMGEVKPGKYKNLWRGISKSHTINIWKNLWRGIVKFTEAGTHPQFGINL